MQKLYQRQMQELKDLQPTMATLSEKSEALQKTVESMAKLQDRMQKRYP